MTQRRSTLTCDGDGLHAAEVQPSDDGPDAQRVSLGHGQHDEEEAAFDEREACVADQRHHVAAVGDAAEVTEGACREERGQAAGTVLSVQRVRLAHQVDHEFGEQHGEREAEPHARLEALAKITRRNLETGELHVLMSNSSNCLYPVAGCFGGL